MPGSHNPRHPFARVSACSLLMPRTGIFLQIPIKRASVGPVGHCPGSRAVGTDVCCSGLLLLVGSPLRPHLDIGSQGEKLKPKGRRGRRRDWSRELGMDKAPIGCIRMAWDAGTAGV